jgi:hypothetical protein
MSNSSHLPHHALSFRFPIVKLWCLLSLFDGKWEKRSEKGEKGRKRIGLKNQRCDAMFLNVDVHCSWALNHVSPAQPRGLRSIRALAAKEGRKGRDAESWNWCWPCQYAAFSGKGSWKEGERRKRASQSKRRIVKTNRQGPQVAREWRHRRKAEAECRCARSWAPSWAKDPVSSGAAVSSTQ